MPLCIMPDGTRELLQWMKEREARTRALLQRRASYGVKKGRAASRRLRRMGSPLWQDTERVIAGIFGPQWARPPFGFAPPRCL